MAESGSSFDTQTIGDVTAPRVPARRRAADVVGNLRGRRRARSVGAPIFDATSFGVDAAMLALAAVASVVSAPAASLRTDVFSLAAFCVLVLAVLVYFGLYRFSFATHFLEDARAIVAATAIVAMCMTFGRVLIFDNPDAAAQAVRAWIFASTYVIAARGGRHIVELRRRREGTIGQRTLIIGAGAVGRQFADRLLQRPEFGLRPVAFLDDDPLEVVEQEAATIPVLGSDPVERAGTRLFGSGLEAALEGLQVSHVVVSFSTSSHQAELDLLRRCQARGVTVSVLPRLFEGVTDDLELERIGGIPIVSVRPSDPQGWQYALKYAFDRIFAALAIVVTSPVMLVAALATLLTLGRPVLFRQARVGLDGKEFDVLKFRTMREPAPHERAELEAGAASEDVAPGGVEGVDRRTRTGTFLRRSSIDELPQLFNVARGDMSLVGPRPERPSYVQLFDESVYRYADRHRVKSGITGWSQVQGLRGNTSIADRVEWDNYYIENRSPWLDFKIILMTVPALLRDFGKPRS
jgi:exopolysaccharide biosynthesis polyprenyl glycosylphosphotransferase